MRFGVGCTDTDIRPRGRRLAQPDPPRADLLYNWEHGAWHPYVGGGLGAHLLQVKDNGNDLGDGESKLGGVVLGGVEYFFTRDAVLTGEFRYQFVQDVRRLQSFGRAAGGRA